MSRVDLFTVIHKGVRALLFELALDTARVDPNATRAVDALVERIERALGFLDEHAAHEDLHVLPLVRSVAPALAAELAAEHRALDVVQIEVERAADALALAELSNRPAAAAALALVVNHLTAVQLIHMTREETEVNVALWAAVSDADLAAIRTRMIESIPRARYAEWMQIVGPALNPVERRLVVGAALG
jgi:hypothetical protein